MPSFLSKVFGRSKKEEKKDKRASQGSLLEGKFEAVSPTVSPSATHFDQAQAIPEVSQSKDKDKDSNESKDKESAGFISLFRPKSRPSADPSSTGGAKRSSEVPHLSLNLSTKEADNKRALGVVFEADPDAYAVLNEDVIGERRLTSAETLLLVRACSQIIIERGAYRTPFCSMSPPVSQKYILTCYDLLGRFGNPRYHAPALVFRVSRRTAE